MWCPRCNWAIQVPVCASGHLQSSELIGLLTQFSLHCSKLACVMIHLAFLPLDLQLKAQDLLLLHLPVHVQIRNSPFPLVSFLVPRPSLKVPIVVNAVLLLLTSLALLPERGSFSSHLRQGFEQFGSSRPFLRKFAFHRLNQLAYLQRVTTQLGLGTPGALMQTQASAAPHLW